MAAKVLFVFLNAISRDHGVVGGLDIDQNAQKNVNFYMVLEKDQLVDFSLHRNCLPESLDQIDESRCWLISEI